MIYLLYIWVFWPFVCGVSNLIRSGWLAYDIKRILPFWGPSFARLFDCLVITAPTMFIFSIYKYLIFLVFLYIGFSFKNPYSQLMKTPLVDIYVMSLRGLIITLPAGLSCGLYKFAFCGIFMGFFYYIPILLPLSHKDVDGYLWTSVDWGDFFFGILLGFFVILNLSQHI